METTRYRVDATGFESWKAAHAAVLAFMAEHPCAAFQYREYKGEGWFAAHVSCGTIWGWLKQGCARHAQDRV
jgi:hypothetical protein